MKQKIKADTQSKPQLKQKRLLEKYKKQDTWMKWAIIAAIIFILLLLLLLGLATDWTRGLHKDNSATPVTSKLDTLRSANGVTGSATPATTTTNGTNGNGSSDTATGNTSNNGSTQSSTGTDTEKTTTTTNNTSATTNNNTTTPTTPPASNSLLDLYTNSSLGDNIDDITGKANILGISKTCHTDVLVQICDFTQNGNTVTVRNILGTGIVTSITKNF